jgi:hypothetical protein
VRFFNVEYKRRREQAVAQGRNFLPYVTARARLKKRSHAGRLIRSYVRCRRP